MTDVLEEKNTTFADIYPLFLSQVDDYEIAQLDEDEIELYIERFLINGLLSLQRIITDILEVDEEKKEFSRKLTLQEKTLVAKSMLLQWTSEKLFSLDLMRKSIGDRDYKAVQGTDYIRRLNDLKQSLRAELESDIVYHSYSQSDYWKVFDSGI